MLRYMKMVQVSQENDKKPIFAERPPFQNSSKPKSRDNMATWQLILYQVTNTEHSSAMHVVIIRLQHIFYCHSCVLLWVRYVSLYRDPRFLNRILLYIKLYILNPRIKIWIIICRPYLFTNLSCVIMSVILMNTLFYKALILQREIWCWSLLGLKGLRTKILHCVDS